MPLSRGAGFDYLQQVYGGLLQESDTSMSVGIAAVLAAPRDGERVSLTFVNLGTSVLWVAPAPQVSATRGIRLGPSGGTMTLSVVQDGTLPIGEWWAIGDAAGGTLYRLGVRREVAQG